MKIKHPRILAIDDTPANLVALGSALEGEFELQCADSCEMGLAQALEDPPDLILLDVMMPDVDGYETLKRIKAQPKLKDIPVIFVTALSDFESEMKGLALGAADYVSKPINVAVVLHRIRNLLERENLRKEVEENRNQLEELVLKRTMALSVANKATEAAQQVKTHFLGNMTHELRTPLNVIIGMTEMAQLLATDPRQVDQLAMVQRASDELLDLINKLMELTALATRRLTPESVKFTLAEVTHKLTEQFTQDAHTKRLRLTITVDPALADVPLLGNEVRIVQILSCLVGNAIKFTAAGQVRALLIPLEQTATSVQLRFEIHDTGIGISQIDQQRVFDVFEQVDNSFQRRHGGAGIGLTISRQLIELMGGTFGVHSQPGVGSVFWFMVRVDKVGDALQPEFAIGSIATHAHSTGANALNDE